MVRIALIGTGRMAAAYAGILSGMRDVELVAVCGNSEESTGSFASRTGLPGFPGNDWKGMFRAHPGIDAVLITTSEWAHTEAALDSFAQGKHVILEKPLDISTEAGRRIVAAASAANRELLVCHTCRFDPRYQSVKDAIGQGGLGSIGYMFSRRNAGRQAYQRVKGKFSMPYWLACHDVDLMRWLTGEEVVEVAAFNGGPRNDGGFLHASLGFGSGARGLIEISWYSSDLGKNFAAFDLEASDGRIELDLLSETRDIASPVMLRHFVDVLKGNAAAKISPADALKALDICEALEKSLAEARIVKLN